MPGKQWEEEESSSSSEAESSPRLTAVRRGKFEDEEEGDSDVLDSWDAAEDSEVEREKAKEAAEAKAKAEAAAAASKKSKAQRIAEHQKRRNEEENDESESDEETEAQRRERLRRTEKESDMRHAQDLFGDAGGVPSGRKTTTPGAAVSVDGKDPNNTINLAQLPLFNPTTKAQFDQLRDVLAPILTSQMKTRHYIPFLEDLMKALAKDLRSEQIKGLSSKLITLSNEKLKQEKAADKSGKKTKAAKTKVSLVANRPHVTDVNSYDDAFGDDDFM